MPDVEPMTMRLSDGRTLAWSEYGDPAGIPAFYFHGTPGGRMEGLWLGDAARQAGVRLFALDRPGYGHSDFKRGRKLRDFPDDVLELAEHLGLDRFAVVGTSGGGPHAQACALSLPERLTSATIISGAGSPEATLAGRSGIRRLFAKSALLLAPLFGWLLAMWVAMWAPLTRPWMIPKTIDRNVIPRPGVRGRWLAETRDGLRQGGKAMAQDLALFSRPWGFDPKDIHGVPVLLWHGEADRIVPVDIGRYFAREIAGCRATFFPDEEHLMFVDHTGEIFAAVVAAAADGSGAVVRTGGGRWSLENPIY